MPYDPDSIWTKCMLEHAALDEAVALAEGWVLWECTDDGRSHWHHPTHEDSPLATCPSYSTDWNLIGPIIDRDHIFLDPPHDVHVHGGPNQGWHRQHSWTATVSARTRTYPNPHDPLLPGCVGRGCGNDPRVAACRAYLVSKGWKP